MKKIVTLAIASCLLACLSAVQCSRPRDAKHSMHADTAAGEPARRDGHGRTLIAYYFHGTVRCQTCLSIEKQARETIETEFADLVEDGTVVFLSLNYDEPENAHFGDDYRLTAPSLVLSLHGDGREITWKNLPKVWDHAHDPPTLREYVADELLKMLMKTN